MRTFSARVRFSAACKARTYYICRICRRKNCFVHPNCQTPPRKSKSSLKNVREGFLRSDNEKNRDECYDGINETKIICPSPLCRTLFDLGVLSGNAISTALWKKQKHPPLRRFLFLRSVGNRSCSFRLVFGKI